MSDGKRRLFLDTETFSSVDISKAGAFKYIESPDFELMLIAYAWDNGPVRVIDLVTGDGAEELPDIESALRDPCVVKVIHNSAFERAVFHKHFGHYMPPEEWEDTMILAAYNGLPMSLDAAGAALQLQDQKIKEGTYDFALDDVEDGFDEIPEELQETEEDRILDEKEKAANEKFDKLMNKLWIVVGAVAAVAIIYKIVLFFIK